MDYNATTPLENEVIKVIHTALTEAWGNPSSSYAEGRKYFISGCPMHREKRENGQKMPCRESRNVQNRGKHKKKKMSWNG